MSELFDAQNDTYLARPDPGFDNNDKSDQAEHGHHRGYSESHRNASDTTLYPRSIEHDPFAGHVPSGQENGHAPQWMIDQQSYSDKDHLPEKNQTTVPIRSTGIRREDLEEWARRHRQAFFSVGILREQGGNMKISCKRVEEIALDVLDQLSDAGRDTAHLDEIRSGIFEAMERHEQAAGVLEEQSRALMDHEWEMCERMEDIYGGPIDTRLADELPSGLSRTQVPSIHEMSQLGTDDASIADYDDEVDYRDSERIRSFESERSLPGSLPSLHIVPDEHHQGDVEASQQSPRSSNDLVLQLTPSSLEYDNTGGHFSPFDDFEDDLQMFDNVPSATELARQLSIEPDQMTRVAEWIGNGRRLRPDSTAGRDPLLMALTNANLVRSWIWEILNALYCSEFPERLMQTPAHRREAMLPVLKEYLWKWFHGDLQREHDIPGLFEYVKVEHADVQDQPQEQACATDAKHSPVVSPIVLGDEHDRGTMPTSSPHETDRPLVQRTYVRVDDVPEFSTDDLTCQQQLEPGTVDRDVADSTSLQDGSRMKDDSGSQELRPSRDRLGVLHDYEPDRGAPAPTTPPPEYLVHDYTPIPVYERHSAFSFRSLLGRRPLYHGRRNSHTGTNPSLSSSDGTHILIDGKSRNLPALRKISSDMVKDSEAGSVHAERIFKWRKERSRESIMS